MDGIVFRTKAPEVTNEQKEAALPVRSDKQSDGVEIKEEVPFTDYQKQHLHPFLVDHFDLGDSWQDKYGGFKDEINTIEGYFRERIEQGQMDNSLEAVKTKFKDIYKLCKIDKTERTTMQIEKLAAYIKFLKETDDIKLNHYKYGY
jgi:hypothetical protein